MPRRLILCQGLLTQLPAVRSTHRREIASSRTHFAENKPFTVPPETHITFFLRFFYAHHHLSPIQSCLVGACMTKGELATGTSGLSSPEMVLVIRIWTQSGLS